MQSLSRAFKRCNAVMIFNNVTKQVETVLKKGTPSKIWNYAVRNKLDLSMQEYQQSVSKPFVRDGEKVIKRRRKRELKIKN